MITPNQTWEDCLEQDRMMQHHVFCDRSGEVVLTPSYADAERAFKRMVRNNPSDLVDWWYEDIDGVQKRVMCCDPN